MPPVRPTRLCLTWARCLCDLVLAHLPSHGGSVSSQHGLRAGCFFNKVRLHFKLEWVASDLQPNLNANVGSRGSPGEPRGSPRSPGPHGALGPWGPGLHEACFSKASRIPSWMEYLKGFKQHCFCNQWKQHLTNGWIVTRVLSNICFPATTSRGF